MLTGLRYLLMSPATGPIATAVAFVLAVTLGFLSNGWQAQRAHYEARIVALTAASARAEAGLRTELATCHAGGEALRQTDVADAHGGAAAPPRARRLLEQQPEGIDACARMESADQAVLSNLKK